MSDLSTELNTVYGEPGGVQLLLDVYHRETTPEEDARRAAIVLIHGGGWFRGDKSKELGLATRLVDAGYVVFVPDYRLAPDHTFPAGRDDVLAAGRWAEASHYLFDRGRVAYVGGSAGGNLSIEAAIATGRPAVSWSGIFDLETIIRSTDATAAAPTEQDLDAMRSADINQTGRDDAFLRWVILQEVGQDRSRLEAASTSRHVTASTGPVSGAPRLRLICTAPWCRLDVGRGVARRDLCRIAGNRARWRRCDRIGAAVPVSLYPWHANPRIRTKNPAASSRCGKYCR